MSHIAYRVNFKDGSSGSDIGTCFGDIGSILEEFEDSVSLESIEVFMDSSTWEDECLVPVMDEYDDFKNDGEYEYYMEMHTAFQNMSEADQGTPLVMLKDLAPWILEMYPEIKIKGNGEYLKFPSSVPFLVTVLCTSFFRCKREHKNLYKNYRFLREKYHPVTAYFASVLLGTYYIYPSGFDIESIWNKQEESIKLGSTSEHIPYAVGYDQPLSIFINHALCILSPFQLCGSGPRYRNTEMRPVSARHEFMETQYLNYSERNNTFGRGEFSYGQFPSFFKTNVPVSSFKKKLKLLDSLIRDMANDLKGDQK